MLVVGTPVDEHLNPDPKFVRIAVEGLLDQLRDGQHLMLRSTVYPRVTAMVEKLISAGEAHDRRLVLPRAHRRGQGARGAALAARRSSPGRTEPRSRGPRRSSAQIAPSIIHLDVEEAELAKLFANTWRYIQFAAANQLFMIANDFGLDFARIRDALKQDYPRLAGMPGPGLAAGPCLLKDTMQLAAFNNNNFTLGHASMMINEGLPLYMVSKLEHEYDLSEMTVGILGMAFKAESDDTRSSLSYKLKRLLRFRAARVLCTDPYAQHDEDLWPLDDVLAESDLLVIATPHKPVRRPRRRHAGRRRVEPAGQRRAGVTPRVSVVIPVYNEGDGIVTCLDRLVDAITLPFEILVVFDSPDDTTRAVRGEVRRGRPAGRADAEHLRARPGVRDPLRDRPRARAGVVVVTMADGSDDPTQVDELARLIERGVVIAAASRYMPGGAQIGAPLLKSTISRWAGLTLCWFARVGTHDATSSFKAYDRAFVQEVGIESTPGSSSRSSSSPRRAGTAGRSARSRRSGSSACRASRTSRCGKWLPLYLHWYFYAFGPKITAP